MGRARGGGKVVTDPRPPGTYTQGPKVVTGVTFPKTQRFVSPGAPGAPPGPPEPPPGPPEPLPGPPGRALVTLTVVLVVLVVVLVVLEVLLELLETQNDVSRGT